MNNGARDDWDQHWDQYSGSAAENPAQSYRRKLVLSLLDLQGKADRVLDIGSGQGDFAAEVKAAHPNCELVGIELSRSGVEQAQRLVPQATFLQRNLLEPVDPAEPHRNWATHAVCSEVLEHLDNPSELLKNARDYLHSGCRLVVTVPGGPMSAFDKHIGHRTHYTPESLRQLLEQSGFQVETAFAAGFPFFNLYRMVVILRGRKLIDDVAKGEDSDSSAFARFVMTVFAILFKLNLTRSPFGWQMVAVARYI